MSTISNDISTHCCLRSSDFLNLALCKIKAARLTARLVFIDESGFVLIPSVRKTRSLMRETSICIIGIVKTMSLPSLLLSPSARSAIVLTSVLGQYSGRRSVTISPQFVSSNTLHPMVLLDNGKTRRGNSAGDRLAHTSGLHVEPFPLYAPELNSDEGDSITLRAP